MPTPRPLFIPHAFVLAATLSVLAPVMSAGGQQIPESVVQGTSLGSEGQAAIRSLVDSNKAGLTGDSGAMKRARNSLIEPLRVAGASVEFRTAYSSAVRPVIEGLVGSERDAVAVSALSIAGELGTRDGLDLLAKGLSDARPQVKVRAALGYARTFVTCREGAPALIPSQVDVALRAIETAMGKETDGDVLDSLGAAIESAIQIPDSKVEGARAKAALLLATSASAVIRRDGAVEGLVPLNGRATRVLFELMRDPNVNLSNEVSVQSAGYAGDVLTRVLRRMESGELSESERAQTARIVTQAERVVITAASRMNQAVSENKLGELVLSGQADRFKQEVVRMAGAGGVLTSPPFGFKADRFTK